MHVAMRWYALCIVIVVCKHNTSLTSLSQPSIPATQRGRVPHSTLGVSRILTFSHSSSVCLRGATNMSHPYRAQENPYSRRLWKGDIFQTTRTDTDWDEWHDDMGVPEVADSYKMLVDLEPFDGVMPKL